MLLGRKPKATVAALEPEISVLMPTSRPCASTSTAVPRVDRRVGLHVDHRGFRLELARDSTDDPERHGILKAQRTAKGQDQLTGSQLVRVTEGQGSKARALDLEHRDVGLIVEANELRRERSTAARQERLASRRDRDFHPDTRGSATCALRRVASALTMHQPLARWVVTRSVRPVTSSPVQPRHEDLTAGFTAWTIASIEPSSPRGRRADLPAALRQGSWR
jgi:hypothetical protein